MKLFPCGHATHPQWQMAAALVLAQVRAQMALHGYATAPTLALLYITDHYAAQAQDILEHLQAELPLKKAAALANGLELAARSGEWALFGRAMPVLQNEITKLDQSLTELSGDTPPAN